METLAFMVSPSEVLIRRFWGFKFEDGSGAAVDFGVALVVSDRQLLVLKEGGVFKKQSGHGHFHIVG